MDEGVIDSETFRDALHDRPQIKVSVGDVSSDDSVRLDPIHVNSKCFFGEYMHGWRIAAEGIYSQQVKPLWTVLALFLFQRKTGIANHNIDFRPTIAQVSKILRIPCNPDHFRVDLIEANVVSRLPIRSKRSDTQADNAHTQRVGPVGCRNWLMIHRACLSNPAIYAVIARCQVPLPFRGELEALGTEPVI